MIDKNNKSWQQQLSTAFKNIDSLCNYLNINPDEIASQSAHKTFPLRVPKSFADCMQKGNLNDPLLKQVLPIKNELLNYQGYTLDPVGDLNAAQGASIIHKYQSRVLLITTGACAINCRYCFRRNFPYSKHQLSHQKLQQAISYIEKDNKIQEVILSGGDPLILSDDKLLQIFNALEKIKHLKRIRIHSRLPIVLPARITEDLLKLLKQQRKTIVFVIHCNHTQELSLEVKTACQKIKNSGITLLNQSVLLKDINDNAAQLIQLSEELFNLGVLPYYLHFLDKAKGVGHFEVTKETGLKLHQEMQAQLSGYLVPKLVQEEQGKSSKTLIF